jgi:hypothetical protein
MPSNRTSTTAVMSCCRIRGAQLSVIARAVVEAEKANRRCTRTAHVPIQLYELLGFFLQSINKAIETDRCRHHAKKFLGKIPYEIKSVAF